MTAKRVHAAARDTDIAAEQLDHCCTADVLRPARMLRPTERIHDRHRSFAVRGRSDPFADLQELVLRRARDARNLFGRIRLEMFLHQLEYATRIFEIHVADSETVRADLVIPGAAVIA